MQNAAFTTSNQHSYWHERAGALVDETIREHAAPNHYAFVVAPVGVLFGVPSQTVEHVDDMRDLAEDFDRAVARFCEKLADVVRGAEQIAWMIRPRIDFSIERQAWTIRARLAVWREQDPS